MKDVYANAIATLVSSTAVYPLDVFKSQLQILKTKNAYSNNVSSENLSKINLRNVAINVYKQGNLYRGLPMFLTTYPCFWTVYFQIYNDKNRLNVTDNKHIDNVILSFIASCAGSTAANPFFVMKTRLQNDMLSGNRKSTISTVKGIYRNEGILGFYKGLSLTMISACKLVVQMPLYSYLYDKTDNSFVSGLTANVTCSAITYPFDVIRTIKRNTEHKLNMRELIYNIMKTQGIKGCYSGFCTHVLMTAPNFTIMMVLCQWLRE